MLGRKETSMLCAIRFAGALKIHLDDKVNCWESLESLCGVFSKEDLHLYLHQIQIEQKLADVEKRVTACEWFCNTIKANPDFLDDLWFSDKAHFLLL